MFSYQKHVATGVKIFIISRILSDLRCDANMFIPVGSKLSREINSAKDLLSKIKSRLDDLVCLENPTRADSDVVNVYYGLVRDFEAAFKK